MHFRADFFEKNYSLEHIQQLNDVVLDLGGGCGGIRGGGRGRGCDRRGRRGRAKCCLVDGGAGTEGVCKNSEVFILI